MKLNHDTFYDTVLTSWAHAQIGRRHCRSSEIVRVSIFIIVVSVSLVLVSFHGNIREWDVYIKQDDSSLCELDG